MKNRYKTIHKSGKDEMIIKKSRFIGYAKPIDSEKDAIDFINEIRTRHKDATHNVYAYVCGENSNTQRYNDDGEPSGTAGIPMLEVLKKENLRNIVVVVTRYFGGIKLGAGGLVRAYIKGAKIALDSSMIIDKVLYTKVKVRIDYTLYGKVENELLIMGYVIDEVTYDDAVNIFILCDSEKVDKLESIITDITSAKARIERVEEKYYSENEGKLIK